MHLKPTLYAVLLTTTLLPGLAFAQSAVPAAAPEPGETTSSSTNQQAHAPDMAARVEQRIKQLHGQLGITPAEQQQWDQFAQVMRDNARAMDQKLAERGAQFASMNAVQDMQSYAEISAQHAQDMQKLSEAFQSLYSVMPDQQKQVADRVFRGRLDRAMHGQGKGHHESQNASPG